MKEELPPGLAMKEASAAKRLSIMEIFKTIDDILNSLNDRSVGVRDDVQKMEEETDPIKFAEKLEQKISDLDEMDFSKFTEKLRKLQTNLTEDNTIFDEAEKNIGGNIRSIGTGIDETDVFQSDYLTVRRFMSSMSGSINDALEQYKEVQDMMAVMSQEGSTDITA